MTEPSAAPRPLSRLSLLLAAISVGTSLVGWGALAVALGASDHFRNEDPTLAWLLLAWLVLGGSAVLTWIAASLTAGVAAARGRSSGETRFAIALAVLIPLAWLVEWALLALWFGYEAMRGPWLFLA